ncbi:unnamed protein product, partial [Rotaria sordida]
GNGYESDIAINDVALSQSGNCAFFTSITQVLVTPQEIVYECDFEENTFCDCICPSRRVGKFEDSLICVYQNDATVDFTWSKHRDAISPSTTDATNDHIWTMPGKTGYTYLSFDFGSL